MLAKEGETVCGDNYFCTVKGNNLRFAICDGLGHGKEAHAAAVLCLKTYKENLVLPPVEQIKQVHTEAKRTRGQ